MAAGPAGLDARLALPDSAEAVVVFAHGGCGRHSLRSEAVAAGLHRAGLGTLLLDLLAEEEQVNRHNIFDIVLLARRLQAATHWIRREAGLPIGYVGDGTGGAAALQAAASDDGIRAVVSLGGQPELAGPAALARVRAPTLFVVGGLDTRGIGLCRLAADWMCCPCRISVVEDTTSDFAAPGALEAVVDLVRDWFTTDRTAATAATPTRRA
ncbi:alpha/beta hydrolase [Streptomyces sp. TRM S81-3]|uniref:Alpha/beta hydrolase n=1 Tax=Streptomyces griseicoloratus TaxID=2752516 RepID=A0A926QU38_9ACTN|nr:alpha/beta hydrolase [Streptomyces griseicoloratus]MBD0422722.1 alpha/beta hydrolase [Streptomyces griseicoloratus]